MVESKGVRPAASIESDFRKLLESLAPLGRIGQIEDISPAAVFFASNDAPWITGRVPHVSRVSRHGNYKPISLSDVHSSPTPGRSSSYSLGMPSGLERFYSRGHLHFITGGLLCKDEIPGRIA